MLARHCTTAFDLSTLEPNRHILLRFVVPHPSQKARRMGTRNVACEAYFHEELPVECAVENNSCRARIFCIVQKVISGPGSRRY